VKTTRGALAILVIGQLLHLVSLTAMAHAGQVSSPFEREYGETLPPIGFVEFCRRQPENCQRESKHTRFYMTAEKWELVRAINAKVNGAIAPIEDEELYGVPEYWTLPTDAGDCEDIMLLKKTTLEAQGIPEESLRITVVLDENGRGHAVLTLVTTSGDYVLDNRRNDVRLWSSTGYTFLKRQTAHSPQKWVALEPSEATPHSASAGTGSH